MRCRSAFAALTVLLGTVGGLVVIEVVGLVLARLRPAYDVVFLEPDAELGWKHVPGLRFTWTGRYWYAADYSVEIRSNSLGFRDLERTPAKPAGVTRVALLGDSLFEALQVPFDGTPGQRLERRLEAEGASRDRAPATYEVLNFGVSNYGIGQFLLVWQEYASRFAPDYVFVLVAPFHLRRTVRRYETGGFPATAGERLWIRPTFRLEEGELKLERARDFEVFERAQRRLIESEFEGRRMRERRHPLGFLSRHLWERAGSLVRKRSGRPRPVTPAQLRLNLKILEALGRAVAGTGGRMAILDVSSYFEPNAAGVEAALRRLCAAQGLGYVNVSPELLEANRNGIATRWAHDSHFNEAGNAILARVMRRWIREAAAEGRRVERYRSALGAASLANAHAERSSSTP